MISSIVVMEMLYHILVDLIIFHIISNDLLNSIICRYSIEAMHIRFVRFTTFDIGGRIISSKLIHLKKLSVKRWWFCSCRTVLWKASVAEATWSIFQFVTCLNGVHLNYLWWIFQRLNPASKLPKLYEGLQFMLCFITHRNDRNACCLPCCLLRFDNPKPGEARFIYCLTEWWYFLIVYLIFVSQIVLYYLFSTLVL